MNHPEPLLISAYLDGDLGSRDQAQVEAHVAQCGACSDLLEEFRAIRDQARDLSDQLPARDLWPGIARAIQEEAGRDPENPDVIRLHPRVRSRKRPRGVRVSVPQAAAAGLILALVSGTAGVGVGRAMGPAPESAGMGVGVATPVSWVALVHEARPDLASVAEEVESLESLVADQGDTLDPVAREALAKNLNAIDRAIRESVAALQEDPGNRFLESNLERAVLSKGEFLRDAAALVLSST